MSGSPKWVEAIIIGAVMAGIESSRYRRARQEEQQRVNVALEERLTQARFRQEELLSSAENLYNQIRDNAAKMEPAAEIRLSDRLSTVIQTLRHSVDVERAVELAPQIESIRHELHEAISANTGKVVEQKIRKIAVDHERIRAKIEEASRRVAEANSQNPQGFDAEGRREVEELLSKVRLQQDKVTEARIDEMLAEVKSALRLHRENIRHETAMLTERQERATALKAEISSLIAGMKADENLMRWAGHTVEELEAQVRLEEQIEGTVDIAALEASLAELKDQELSLVKKANEAQIKADQRDYIATSIRSVLESMGFFVSEITEEHPGHPATSVLFRAVNAAGKGVNVSIPVDGEVWYDVDGYTKTTESRVGGGTAAVCDEAEGVIGEMHELLEQEFSVKMGDLMWENKDPDRILREMDELPRSDNEQRGDAR